MGNKGLPWKILSDEEVKRREDDAFGIHTAYAELLLEVAKECPTPFSIGLYSGWGTGKTSIVRLLQALVDQDVTSPLTVIYLDVWKYSSDPLKRWILLETEKQLKDKKLLDKYEYEKRVLQSHLEFDEEIEHKDTVEFDFKNFSLLAIACILIIVLSVLAWVSVPPTWPVHDAIRLIAPLFAGGGLLALIGGAALKKLGEFLPGLLFRRSVKHVTAKPAFSSEKFNAIFRDIVAQVNKNGKKRLLFVFDNLDRCAADVAVETIGVVKTFLDEPGCIYVIPCDEQAILTHIKRNFLKTPSSDTGDAYANQFLTKFFQMTLRLPPAADFAVSDYLDNKLKQAEMQDLTIEARDVLVLGYRGETPRQVKRVLNDLIAYRGIANQIEADGLLDKDTLTGDLGHLTKMAVLSVKWPGFMRKIADDPEKWTEVMQSIRTRHEVDLQEIGPDLVQFLWNTRLVSPDADIRPWLYLTRGSLEKDAALNRRIEKALQDGSWKQLSEIIAEKEGDKKKQVLQIAAATGRRWMKSGRRLLLRNGGPVLLKASQANPEDRELRRDALNILDYLAKDANPEEMEQLYQIDDVLAASRGAAQEQRSHRLGRFCELFETRFPMTERRTEIWNKLIGNGDLLSDAEKRNIQRLFSDRYSMPTSGEGEVLGLLEFAAAEKPTRAWVVKASLLTAIASSVTFDKSQTDTRRLKILIAFRDLQDTFGLNAVLKKVASSVDPARTTQVDALAEVALDTLSQLDIKTLKGEAFEKLVDALLAQTEREAIRGRGAWLNALINLYPVLKEDHLVRVDALLKSSFVDSDPTHALELVNSLPPTSRAKLFNLDRPRIIFRGQPSAYQARYGTNATAHRQKFIKAFEPRDVVVHPDVFDDSLSWDLALFVTAAGDAVNSQQVNTEEAESRLSAFCGKYLPSSLSTQTELYAAIVALAESNPDVLRTQLANLLATCELNRLLSDDFSTYNRFEKFKQTLPLERRRELIGDVLTRLAIRNSVWIPLLLLVISDVIKDKELSADSQIVRDLADLAFQAARENWTETASALVTVLTLLRSEKQQDYVERSLDVLAALSAEGEDLPRMEPFLRVVAAFPGHITGTLETKVTRFVDRMLGVSKSEPAKLRALNFLSGFNDGLVSSVKEQVERLSESSDANVSEEARRILQRLAS